LGYKSVGTVERKISPLLEGTTEQYAKQEISMKQASSRKYHSEEGGDIFSEMVEFHWATRRYNPEEPSLENRAPLRTLNPIIFREV
jgi:hypothetical protein